jgi:hypothetical protein
MKDELDEYLREASHELKKPRRIREKQPKRKRARAGAFKRWAASAAMDLFKFYIPVVFLVITGGLCLIASESIAKYFFYALVPVLLVGLIFCAYDFYQYSTWTRRLKFTLEGWNNIVNNRSAKYWDMNGEHWLPVKIQVDLLEPVKAKHVRVLEAFLKKLQKRLNKWTVSSSKHVGYSQPNGWTREGLVLSGDMNPRVQNLMRKRFSKELNHLAQLMPGAIHKVVVSQTGGERYHQVYQDPAD